MVGMAIGVTPMAEDDKIYSIMVVEDEPLVPLQSPTICAGAAFA